MGEPTEEPVLSDEEDSADDVPDLSYTRPPVVSRAHRASVSAEAFGDWNKIGAHFTPPVYTKTLEQMGYLSAILTGSFLFHALEKKDLETVILAMEGPYNLEPGHRIIAEGELGAHLYVVTEGSLDCTKVLDGAETVVKTCVSGDLFGELAILYNCPRAASVVSREASTVWRLDRETFNTIAMSGVERKRKMCSAVLREVEMFKIMTEQEVDTVIDVLKVERYQPGEVIITQGETGNKLYLVYEGEVVATKMSEGYEPAHFVHKVGDYFGELALLRNEPRAATVSAATEVTVLSMDSPTFQRLMGPAEAFLHRMSSRYG